MIDVLVRFAASWPPEVAVAALAALPVTELRGALPLGMTAFGLDPASAYAWAVFGNLLPIPVLFALLPWLIHIGKGHEGRVRGLIDARVRKLERKYGERYDRYGWMLLILITAAPLPGSGVWTASLLAVLFRVERRLAIPAIVVGVAIAGLIVLGITTGAIGGAAFLLG